MKLEYIKPEIIELPLELEGSFLNKDTHPGVPIVPGDGEGGEDWE